MAETPPPPTVDMHALAANRRALDPDLKYAHDKRLERARVRADVSKLRAANEALALDLEAARLELASRPVRSDADVAGLPELAGLWSALVRDEGANVRDRLEASRLLADALGLTKGGARDAGGDASDRETVSAVVIESALATERARLRRALEAAGSAPEVIAAALGEG